MAEQSELAAGKPAKAKGDRRRWDVLVMHSPFALKHAVIEAASPTEAQGIFLGMVKEKHQQIVERIQTTENDALARRKRVMGAYEEGLKRVAELEWFIRPAEDVERERASLKARREQSMGPMNEAPTVPTVTA